MESFTPLPPSLKYVGKTEYMNIPEYISPHRNLDNLSGKKEFSIKCCSKIKKVYTLCIRRELHSNE